jgi:hypothetical protein
MLDVEGRALPNATELRSVEELEGCDLEDAGVEHVPDGLRKLPALLMSG